MTTQLEPDVVFVTYAELPQIGRFNGESYEMDDGFLMSKEFLADCYPDAQFFYTSPPNAKAIEAAALMKAIEVCKKTVPHKLCDFMPPEQAHLNYLGCIDAIQSLIDVAPTREDR